MQIHTYKSIEFSEVSLQELSSDLRIDADFYQPQYIRALQAVDSVGSEHLGALQAEIIHPTEVKRIYSDEGIQILLAQNIRNNVLDFNNKVFMPGSLRKTLSRNRLVANDVVMTRSGANFGQTSYYLGDPQELFACADCLVIRTNRLNGLYLSTYLNCSYGKLLVDRGSYGMAQPHIAPSYLYKLQVPLPSTAFQRKLEGLIKQSFEKKQVAESSYKAAENLLLKELGLQDWKPDTIKFTHGGVEFEVEDTISEIAFIEVSDIGRIDAEYFCPAKKAALDFLAALPGKTVGELFTPIRELWQPGKASPTDYVRNYDLTDALSPFLDDTKPPTLPLEISSTKKRILNGDIVVSRLRSYLKEIAVVLDGGDVSLVGSMEFFVLRPKKHSMKIETLLVYLRSILPQLIFKWSQDGSNHPRFNERELLNLRVPDLLREHEDVIVEQVQSAISARRKSRDLLDLAKCAVEVFIEDGEKAALALLGN
jgi:type I restriction enzyme S subunit